MLVADAPVLTFAEHSTGGETTALAGGEVARDGRCLTLGAQLVLWPVGTTREEAAFAVLLPDGTAAAAVAVLSGGGGVIPFNTES